MIIVFCLNLTKKITGQTGNDGTKDVEIMVPTFSITDTKLYVPIVTLSTEDNAKLLLQLKSGFKLTINWNEYHKLSSKKELIKKEVDNEGIYYLSSSLCFEDC